MNKDIIGYDPANKKGDYTCIVYGKINKKREVNIKIIKQYKFRKNKEEVK